MIVAVVGGKGGVGTSTLAYELAATTDGVVVDADLAMADLPHGKGPDLHDVLAGRAAPTEALRGGPVTVVSCGRSLAGARSVDVRALGDALDAVEAASSPVLVDCPAGLRADAGVSLATAERALLVASPRRFTFESALRARALARLFDAGLAGVALNQVDTPTETGSFERLFGAPVTPVSDDPRLDQTLETGRPLVDRAPDSDAVRAIAALGDAVQSRRSV